jgi:hypothetical protein
MNYRNLGDMATLIRANLHRIPRLPVVGIPRSGMIAASMIATLKNVPLYSFRECVEGNDFLLVDDSVSGGETFANALKYGWKPTTLAVYVKPQSPKPDIWLEELPGPRVFEWNWAKHAAIKRAVLDIDGVLCTDGDGYSPQHCVNAPLLHKPAREVLAIATGRREEMREITEHWLAQHNIKYKHIFFSTNERGARHTKLLAAQETGAKWIVESNANQANWLRLAAGVHVLCTDLNQMLLPLAGRD